MLCGDAVFCQRIEDDRRKVSQFQHSLNVAGRITQQITDLCRCFAFLRHCTESGNLFGRVHIPTMTVLGHRCGSRQLLRNDLHTDRPVNLNDVTLCQHVECCQSATTCGDTVTVTWQGMNNQIL
ncbi:hypothetical protein ECAA86_04774 (plasmid) [Escherichia coli AA86]|nr:hypothetical protein ECAA86_04774 [Escherichia coli AA86]